MKQVYLWLIKNFFKSSQIEVKSGV